MNREDLKNYKYTQEWIRGRIEYIEQYKSTINKLTSTLSDMPKGSRQVQDNEAEKLSKLLDCVNELMNKIDETNKVQMEILKCLDNVEQPYKNILDKYYIQGKTLVKVADEMHYDYEYVKHMNGVALNKFDEKVGK